MLLTLHNLPPDMRYSDIKSLLREKCGLTEVILDNLLPTGNSKKVTIGVSEEADAAIIVRKINGLHLKGQQLYVEDIRKKRKANEQPFRTSDSYYSADTIKELVPETAAIQPYVDPQAAYQMNYAMMAGMYGGYIPPVQDPNYGYAAQAMPVMPVVPALHPTGMPVTNLTNNWQTSQSQGDPWQNTQGRAEPRQTIKDREDPWKNPQTRESFRQDRNTRDDLWKNSQGFIQDRKGRGDSRQNHSARESFRPKSAPHEDTWNNTNTKESSRQHQYNQGHLAGDKSIQERASRWAAERTALLETPVVEEARPYFDHGRPEMPRRDERRRSPGNRRWASTDRAGYGHEHNDYNDDRRQRSPHASGRYEPEPKIVHYTVNSVNVNTVVDRGFTGTRRTERHVVAEPARYGPRSPERDNSRPRPSRAKRDFEEPPRPFRAEKRARFDEPYQAAIEDRQTYEEPAFPAPIENVTRWDEPRHSRERQDRRFKEAPTFDTPRPEIADRRPPEMTQAKMMNREETHRQQATAKIAKIMSERSSNMFSVLFMKILKQTLRIRLDRILRDECGNEVADMLRRYTEKFPRAADLHTIKAVSKRVDLIVTEREMQTSSQSNNGDSADVAPQVTPATVQAPRKPPAASNVKAAPAPSKPLKVPKGDLPRFPNTDKSLVHQQKQMRKLESQHDDLYPLPPKTKAALDKELDAIANAIKEECADPTEEDKITCERIKTETVDDMKRRNYRESSDSPLTSDTSTETVLIGLASPDPSPVDNFTGTNMHCDSFVKEDNVNSQTDIKFEVREVKSDTFGKNGNIERQNEIKHTVKETFEAKRDIFEKEDNVNSQTEINNEVIEACKANCELGNSGSQPEIPHEIKEEEPYEDSILVDVDQEDFYNDKIFNINDKEEEAFIDKILCTKQSKKHDIIEEYKVADEIILPNRRKKCQREDVIVNMNRNEHSDDIDTENREDDQISYNTSGDSDVELQEKIYDSITKIRHNKTEIPLPYHYKALSENIAETDFRIVLGCGKRQIVLNSKLTDNNTNWAAIHDNASENNTSQNIYDNVNTEMLQKMHKPVISESELIGDVIDSVIKIPLCKRRKELGSKLSDNETKLVETDANNSSKVKNRKKNICGIHNYKRDGNKSANMEIYLDEYLEDEMTSSRRKRRRRRRKKLSYETTQWAQSNSNNNKDDTSQNIYDNLNTEMVEVMYKPVVEDDTDSDINIPTSYERNRELYNTKLVETHANNSNEDKILRGIYNCKKDENKSANMEIYLDENIVEDEIRSSRRKRRRSSRKKLSYDYDTTQWAQSNINTNEDNTSQEYPDNDNTGILEITNEPAHLKKTCDEDISECDIKTPSSRCKQRSMFYSMLEDDQTNSIVSNSNKENTVCNCHNNGKTQEPDMTNISKEMLVRNYQESDVNSLFARLSNEDKGIKKDNTTNTKINWQYREKDIDDLLAKIRKQEES